MLGSDWSLAASVCFLSNHQPLRPLALIAVYGKLCLELWGCPRAPGRQAGLLAGLCVLPVQLGNWAGRFRFLCW